MKRNSIKVKYARARGKASLAHGKETHEYSRRFTDRMKRIKPGLVLLAVNNAEVKKSVWRNSDD